MAAPGIKFDDGSQGFASNCFPVRGLFRSAEEGSGAWLVAHRAEQRRRFKAILCSKPRDYDQIRQERKKSEKDGTAVAPPPAKTTVSAADEEGEEDDSKVLDGFFLMRHCCVEDPTDLCSVNISDQGFSEVKVEDFQLFDNVAYINASENFLSLDCFRNFPILRELEMPLNGMRGVQLALGDFPNLETLDLSYNNLSPEDILPLGLLPNLRVLHLTGNGIKELPAEMSLPYHEKRIDKQVARFHHLEMLTLDDNRLSDMNIFATLASLVRLKHLNLSKNQISLVPQLTVVDGHLMAEESSQPNSGCRSKRSSRGTSRRSRDSISKARDKTPTSPLKDFMGDLKLEHIPEVQEDAGTVSNRTANALSPSREMAAEEALTLAQHVEKQAVEGQDPPEANTTEDSPIDSLPLEELNLTDLETKVQDDMRRDKALKQDMFANTFVQDSGGLAPGMPPPFPELRHLNLSYNKISEEENLLGVAAWPLLSELLIHDNPLTTENVGDPPLLKRFLHDRLGIHIQRQRPGPLQKPHVEVPQKAGRKVKTKVPPVPRCNVDELLALEAPPMPALPKATPTPPETGRQSVPTSIPPNKPLPPIPGTPEAPGHVQEGWTETREEPAGDPFFMTQVDEPVDGQTREEAHQGDKTPTDKKKPEKRPTKARGKDRAWSPASSVSSRYRGYEELLYDDDSALDDEDIPMPKDIHGNIRALKYALNHPLVFRDNVVELHRPQKPFQPYHRSKGLGATRHKTKHQKATEALHSLKNRSTVEEERLDKVLQNKPKYKKHFGNADQLFAEVKAVYDYCNAHASSETSHTPHCSHLDLHTQFDLGFLGAVVQRRFNAVRQDSLKDAREVRELLHSTMQATETDGV